jgi:tRNA 2-thiouridine synthesizing protein A
MNEIDATGLHCPLPVLRLQKALREIKSGASVTLLASDLMAAIDVPHFCSESGHKLIAQSEKRGAGDMQILKFEIEKGA